MRTAIIGGQAHGPLTFDRATKWHRLSYEGGTWVTDEPIEQQQHDDMLAPFSGRVLVGGLGIGYAANVLAAREEVEEIVVVESAREVCTLVGPHVKDPGNKVEIVNADLFEFLKENESGFDWAFYDIWQSDGEGTFHHVVCPLRSLSEDWIRDDRVVCWNENVMRGQLFLGLSSKLLMLSMPAPPGCERLTIDKLCAEEEEGGVYWNWSVPFWKAYRAGRIDHENFGDAAGDYAGTYGHVGWQEWFEETYDVEVA